MEAKVILKIEREVYERAEVYAKENKLSLSDIVETYLKSLTEEEVIDMEKELIPIVKQLKGSFEIPKDLDYKKESEDA